MSPTAHGALPHVLPQGSIVLTKSAVNDRDGNPMRVDDLWIYCNPVFRSCQHLSESSQLKITGLQASDLLLERPTEAIQVIGLVRNQEVGELKLIVKSSHVVALGSLRLNRGM
jgi:hypothetical protein